MAPESISEALEIYHQYLKAAESHKKAGEILNLTRTALTRYTLPSWGCPAPAGRKPTRAETNTAAQFLLSCPLEKIKGALEAQAKVFDELGSNPTQRNTYSSKLKNFVDWIKKQGWLSDDDQESPKNYTPRMNLYKFCYKKNTTNRTKLRPYGLKPTDASEKLNKEIKELVKFLSIERYPGRLIDSIKPSVAKQYETKLYQIFGWFVKYKNIQPQELTFDDLVPISGKYNKAQEETKKYVEEWICSLLNFLEKERKCAKTTLVSHLRAILALTKFQFRTVTKKFDYNDILVVEVIRRYSTDLQKKSKGSDPVADQALKWLDLEDIFEKIVAPLREECQYRGLRGQLRSINAITCSFHIFIMWGMLTLRPPRRQQELRGLKIGLSCSLKKKPKDLLLGEFIHPLPLDRNDVVKNYKGEEEDNRYHGFLFKSEDGKWYMDMSPESYKTGKTYKHQQLEVPNTSFPDGKCFYDYLEAYLYGYWRNSKGNWISGGKTTQSANQQGKWYSLRMNFNPLDNYLFVKRSGGDFFSQNDITAIFKNAAYRLTGQQVTPHLLRDIYATWFLDQAYTEDRITSLAYAMGHSVKMLRSIYDQRRPEQKNRPIEEALAEVVATLLSQQKATKKSATDANNDVAPADIDPRLWEILTPEQKSAFKNIKALS